jgi:Asp-tRNA(Asn)/Glu-tRNA(Gln) amidotransferase A subunit family amidase
LREGYTPGGSSGGSAAAVADHLCTIAMGTDTMGSVRIPAAYCGVMGMIPSRTRLPMDGIVPLSPTLDVAGPLARSGHDLAQVMACLLGVSLATAVDANVLINERIREEIRRGRQTIQAVEFGYKEASTAIFDANITNVISALILFWFGSGPIKGFAVVLALGIATSVFTGVTFTRLLVSQYLQRNRPKTLVL